MGIPVAMIVFTAGTTIASTDVNSNLANLYNVLNGNVDDANIKAGAAINWSKLAPSTGRNIVFGTTYGITSDLVLGNNWIQQYNVSLPAPMSVTGSKVVAYNTTVVAGAWANRTTTNICLAYVTTSAGLEQMWYAPSAGVGAAPVWTKAFEVNNATGAVTITGGLALTGTLVITGGVSTTTGFTPGVISTGNLTGAIVAGASFSITITHSYGRLVIPSLWVSGTGGYIQLSANTINSFTIEVHNTTGVNQSYTYGYAY